MGSLPSIQMELPKTSTVEACEYCGKAHDPDCSDSATKVCEACYHEHVFPAIKRVSYWNHNRYAVSNYLFNQEIRSHPRFVPDSSWNG